MQLLRHVPRLWCYMFLKLQFMTLVWIEVIWTMFQNVQVKITLVLSLLKTLNNVERTILNTFTPAGTIYFLKRVFMPTDANLMYICRLQPHTCTLTQWSTHFIVRQCVEDTLTSHLRQAAILESATNLWLLVLSILHNHAAQPHQPYYQASVTITLGRRV